VTKQADVITHKYRQLLDLVKRYLGYPCTAKYHYKNLLRFSKFPLNNIGDPFAVSNFQVNTHDLEREVIAYIANLYGEQQQYWGYVSSGGTEGNILGLHFGRSRYPTARVYYSQHSHYSIHKALALTRSEAVEVPAQPSGEIDYAAFSMLLSKNKDHPVIVIANIGTTMTGAIDDVHKIKASLACAKIKQFYIHCDAALHGLILPFCKSHKMFALADIDSLTVSGHKLLGMPFPCGVFLCKKSVSKSFTEYVDYIHTGDLTLSGSRNGLAAVLLWEKFFEHRDITSMVSQNLKMAAYAVQQMQKWHIDAWVNEHSPIVVFPKPSDRIIKKWQLAQKGALAHIVTLSHVGKKTVNAFVKELADDLTR